MSSSVAFAECGRTAGSLQRAFGASGQWRYL